MNICSVVAANQSTASCGDLEIMDVNNIADSLDTSIGEMENNISCNIQANGASLNLANLVDSIATSQSVIQDYSSRKDYQFSIQDQLSLQQNLSEFSSNSQLLSKVVGIAVQDIDTLTRIQ